MTVAAPAVEAPAVSAPAAAARAAAERAAWAALPVARRLDVIRTFRHALAGSALAVAATIARPQASAADLLVAEILPLLAACRFLEQRAAGILRTGHPRAGRPLWLSGTRLTIRRVPFGTVLVIGPGNYPLLLPAVQALQALVAGNAVLAKPAPSWSAPMLQMRDLLARAGLPETLFIVLPDSAAAAGDAVRAGVDLIVLTGSSATGRAVLAEAAPRLTPAIMELSGDDPFIVLPGADMAYAARALAFGRALNGGNTCIAPRRVLVTGAAEPGFRAALASADPASAQVTGADVAVRVVADAAEAVAVANESAYALGAAVFGPLDAARWVAARLRAGCVVIGDVIAPTADPRLPFGGAGESGFGTTRGAEGLLAMTRPQAIVERRRPEPRHLTVLPDRAAPMVAGLLRVAYGPFAPRAIADAMRAIRAFSRG
jgi:acyl-CoA reductase-like NAD-dependent aldehyde dehydrogenase